MPQEIRRFLVTFLFLGAIGLPCLLGAEENSCEWGPQLDRVPAAAPKRVVDTAGIEPGVALPAADEAALAAIADWNLSGGLPLQNGVERPLPKRQLVVLSPTGAGSAAEPLAGGVVERGNDGTIRWGTAIRVDGAWRLRILLGALSLPPGTQAWVYGEGSEIVGPFGTELIGPDGTLWTPSVGGPEIRLELAVPTASPGGLEVPTLRVESVAELFPLDERGLPVRADAELQDTSCLIDAACAGSGDFSAIDTVKHAVAHLQFQVGGSSYICTGSLVNDKVQGTWVPYLLTANHCFSTQSAASSLEAFFDYYASICGGAAPSLGSRPRSSGAALLKTSAANDFTFVRLNNLPNGRSFLGWTTSEPGGGQKLHRISHPSGLKAHYSAGAKIASPADTCGLGGANYHHTNPQDGSIAGGSSGAAITNANGQIVGQLYGFCGPNVEDPCDTRNRQVDGKFSVTFPQISQYINVEGGSSGSCTNDLTNGVVCLRSRRFEFTGTWTDFSNPAVTKPLIWTPVEDINATGGFQNNPSGIQVVMRVADGCSQTGTWWVWLGGFTDAGWSIRVRDTVTGKQRTFNRTRQSGVFPSTQRDATTFNCN
jgi:hypothetical protein